MIVENINVGVRRFVNVPITIAVLSTSASITIAIQSGIPQ